MIEFNIDGETVSYNPETGSFRLKSYVGSPILWRFKKAVVRMRDGCCYPAMRMAYDAVHGPLPMEFNVYAINGNPYDLRIDNIGIIEVNLRNKASYGPAMRDAIALKNARNRT